MIPEKINVGGVEYRIDQDSNERLAHNAPDGATRMGEFDGAEAKIILRKGMPASAALETLAHEILHAFLNHTGSGMSQDDEELLVQRLANPFFRFLVDNELSFFRGT